jgi:hypothetical protein
MFAADTLDLLAQIARATADTRDLLGRVRAESALPANAAAMLAGAPGAAGLADLVSVRQGTAVWREHAAVLAEAGRAYDGLGRFSQALAPELERLGDLGRSFGVTLADALGGIVLRGEGALETLRALERQLLGVLAQRLVTAPLDGFLGRMFGSLGGGLLGGLGGILGLAEGGSFRVGGSGGRDSQLVPLRLSPGELVEVTPPGEAVSRGREAPITLNISVRVGPDLAGRENSGRTGRQLARDLARQLVPVLREL